MNNSNSYIKTLHITDAIMLLLSFSFCSLATLSLWICSSALVILSSRLGFNIMSLRALRSLRISIIGEPDQPLRPLDEPRSMKGQIRTQRAEFSSLKKNHKIAQKIKEKLIFADFWYVFHVF